MEPRNRTIARLTAPTVLVFAWALFGGGAVLAEQGEVSLSVVRFAAALAFGVSAGAAIRVWEASGRRGDTWDGLFVAAPLPYFDSELRGRVVRTRTAATALCGSLLALAGLCVAALFAFATPPERGTITLSDAAPATAWADLERSGVGRELPVELALLSLDVSEGVLEVGASRIQDDWQSQASLRPGESMLVDGLEAEWVGLVPEDRVARVGVDVTVGELTERVEVTVGGSAEALGQAVRVVEFDPNRLGAMGPAARIAFGTQDQQSAVWLHLWGPEVHGTFAQGDVSLALRELAPASSALLEVRTPWPTWLLPVFAVLSGLALAGLLRFATSPVFIRGRSGDYEIVGPNRRAVRAAARALLSDADHAEWERLLVTLRATGRASQ